MPDVRTDMQFMRIWRRDKLRLFGTRYVLNTGPDGGELFITRYGWSMLAHIDPANWYNDRRYLHRGERLSGGTGTVYRVPSFAPGGRRADMVVKFCRFGERVPMVDTDELPEHVSPEDVAAARFNSPFEEFGMLRDLRRGLFGPRDLRIRTKRPLAIYCPPDELPLWKLGRTPAAFIRYLRAHERGAEHLDPDHHLHIDRRYVLLFHWVNGENAEDLYQEGLLTDEQLEALTRRVGAELHRKGFMVLDHKPKHFILRRRRDGSILRRDGNIVYALVDFELLFRTPEYEAYRRRHPLPHG